MRVFIVLFLGAFSIVLSQFGNFRVDDGKTIKGFYNGLTNFEESVLVKPNGPGLIKKVYIYLAGTVAKKDTIWITQDPTDGYMPGSLYCNYISSYNGYVIDYKGKQDWYEIDLESLNINTGGINGIWIQHVIKPNGPYFVIDNEQNANNYTSFINDVYKPNPNFYNIKGTMVSITQGDYIAGVDIEYHYPKDGKSADAPVPTLNDLTKEAGLLSNNGGGLIASEMVSATDWNKDGWVDIAIKSQFFENNKDGTFSNVSNKINAPNNGAIWADLDNDSFLDFFAVNGWGNDKLYWGNADFTFSESTDDVIKHNAPTVSPLLFDYDGDGLVDIYVAYGRKEESGKETYYADKLFKNLGNRKFKDVTQEAGITAENSTAYDCWGASLTDYNADGYPDVFVATYRLAPDLLYRNNGNGTFTEVGAITGARGAQTYSPGYFGHGMGSDWADMDNDGDLDLCVGNLAHWDERALASNPSLLLVNSGAPDYKFNNTTLVSGLKFFEMNSGTVWADLDLDGYQDLVHCQYSYEAKGKSRDKYTRFYMNQGAENFYKLEDKTWEFGSYIHGAWSPVRIDYDNDGDMDLLIGSSNENVKLFENNIERKGEWLSIKLIASPTDKYNTNAYGAWVTVSVNGKKYYRNIPGSILNARASQSSNALNFGLGENEGGDKAEIEVKFGDGKVLKFSDVELNRRYAILYNGQILPQSPARPTLAIPRNNTDVKNDNIVFSWHLSGGAESYKIQISESNNFANVALEKIVTVNEFTASNLMDGRKYYWRVNAIADGKESMWSPIWSLNAVNSALKPNAPKLQYPTNNSTKIDITPNFYWESVTGCKFANIQIAEDAGFTKIAIDGSKLSASDVSFYSLLSPEKLNPLTLYYWRVRLAYDKDDSGNQEWSDWSETWNFTTAEEISVEEEIRGLMLAEVSPNPANNFVEITFNLENEAKICLDIYNIDGELIQNVINNELKSGLNKYRINTEKFAQGTYFYTINVNGVVSTKKFVISR